VPHGARGTIFALRGQHENGFHVHRSDGRGGATTSRGPHLKNPLPWAALALAIVAADSLGAQEADAPEPALSPAIEDNSFFIEEAYNQEEGVVQHISSFVRFGAPVETSEYGFTQEWPLGRGAHQLSLTLPYSWSSVADGAGFGDALRYTIDVGALQIVPGMALPLRRADGRTSAGVFAYLSFEHPFKASRRAAARAAERTPGECACEGI
jgi:hypothetical protein